MLEQYMSMVREWVPNEARRAFEQVIPMVESDINVRVDEFGKQLGDFVKAQIDEELARQQEVIVEARVRVQAALRSFRERSDVAAGDVEAAANELEAAVKAYEDKWRGLGKQLGDVAKTAARAAGLPVPV